MAKNPLTRCERSNEPSTISRESKRRRVDSNRSSQAMQPAQQQTVPSVPAMGRIQQTGRTVRANRQGNQGRVPAFKVSTVAARATAAPIDSCVNREPLVPKSNVSRSNASMSRPKPGAVQSDSSRSDPVLLTPNKKRVDISDFSLSVDIAQVHGQNQARTHAAYRAELDRRLMEIERSDEKREEWFANFSNARNNEGSSLENCRLEAIRRYFEYGKVVGVRSHTVYLAVHTLGRLFLHLLTCKALTREMVVGCIGSAWRLAVKWNEVPHIAYKASLTPGIQKNLVFWDLPDVSEQEFDGLISRVETHCADILGNDISVPFSVDFFDRFLDIGGWPTNLAQEYRELGHFLISICCFDTSVRPDQEKSLHGTYPSQLASAALALAVKIINTDANAVAYDYYPQRLESYTGYSMKVLKPTIRGISQILRDKPKQSEVLSLWFPTWAVHDWR